MKLGIALAGLILVGFAPFVRASFLRSGIRRQCADQADGTVTNVEWTNPHSFFYLDVKDKDGKVSNWKLEGFPPSVLYRTGWKKSVTLKAGDVVTVTGWRARDGGEWGHSREVTFQDGKKLFFGPPAGTGDGGNAPAVAPPAQGK